MKYKQFCLASLKKKVHQHSNLIRSRHVSLNRSVLLSEKRTTWRSFSCHVFFSFFSRSVLLMRTLVFQVHYSPIACVFSSECNKSGLECYHSALSILWKIWREYVRQLKILCHLNSLIPRVCYSNKGESFSTSQCYFLSVCLHEIRLLDQTRRVVLYNIPLIQPSKFLLMLSKYETSMFFKIHFWFHGIFMMRKKLTVIWLFDFNQMKLSKRLFYDIVYNTVFFKKRSHKPKLTNMFPLNR